MKLTLRELRRAIREEYIRGVPEFLLREATTKYVNEIRKHVKLHIQMTAKDPSSAREKIAVANEVLKQLEDEANQLLENKLWQFVQNT